jgi:plastocyanin
MSGRLTFVLILSALIASAACSSSTSPSSSTGGSTTTVSIPSGASTLTTTAYAPNPVTIARGTSVTWVNNDNTAHTATSNDGSTFNSGSINPGGQFTMTFPNAGSFPYKCTLHPNMVGTVTVQ